MCMPKARSLAYPRPLSGLHYGAAAPRLVMATCRLSISAPPELSPFYGDSDYYQPGFSHHGHERARTKSLKTNLAEVINKRSPRRSWAEVIWETRDYVGSRSKPR